MGSETKTTDMSFIDKLFGNKPIPKNAVVTDKKEVVTPNGEVKIAVRYEYIRAGRKVYGTYFEDTKRS